MAEQVAMESNLEGNEQAPYKRRKKKSYLQRAKKFGKSGRFGKGREIDRETYDYFVRILEQINVCNQDDEDFQVFVDNVFDQTVNEEASLAGNQLVSRVLERLLPLASIEIQTRFMHALADDLRRVATDPFASHVLELLLIVATFQPAPDQTDFRRTWVLRVSKFLINNMEDFCPDAYASHLLRTCFQCLGGSRLDESLTRSRRSRDQKMGHIKDKRTAFLDQKEAPSCIHSSQNTDSDFDQVLSLAVDKIVNSENVTGKRIAMSSNEWWKLKWFFFSDLVCAETSSGVVQSLLLVLNEKSLKSECKKVCSFLLEQVYENATMSESEEDQNSHLLDQVACCRLLEAMIIVSSQRLPKLFNKIVSKVFKDKILKWAIHPTANFPLQKLLAHCPDKEQFEKWYQDELDQNVEEILASGNSGVILSIAQSCRKLNAKQAHFLVVRLSKKKIPMLIQLLIR